MQATFCALCFIYTACGTLANGLPGLQGEQIQALGTRKGGSDWPGFLGPTGDSKSPEKGIITPWPKKGLPIVWQMKTGDGYGMPAISRGRLFLFDRHRNKARLTCMNSETGKELWRFEYPCNYEDKYNYSGGPRCCPVVDEERVYIHGVEGMLHCLRISDGKLLWKVDTQKEFNIIQNFFGVGSTPVLEGELLIVPIGGSPQGTDPDNFAEVKGNGSGVVAFDRKTGKLVYSISDELASYTSPVLATINQRRWCFVFARGGLIGFHPKTGTVDFHFPWRSSEYESANAANPVVVGDKVLISETYGPGSALLEVKPGGYRVLWSDKDKREREKALQCHWNTPIHVDGYLYACSGRHTANADLRCVELTTGKVMWRVPRVTRCTLLFIDNHFIALGEYGHLIMFRPNPKKFDLVSVLEVKDPKTDEPLLDYPCWAPPIVSHGLMYLRGRDRLVCLELIPQPKSN